MMIVCRFIEITDLILELAGMRSYTGNGDLDSGARAANRLILQFDSDLVSVVF